MTTLSKPLVVPQFGNYNASSYMGSLPYSVGLPPHTVNLFAPNGANPPSLSAIDLDTIFTNLDIDPTQYLPSPNACLAIGADLYVAISGLPVASATGPAAAILKFAGYFTGTNTTAAVTAAGSASIFTDLANGYCGMAWDGAANLYTVENMLEIFAYPLADNGMTRTVIFSGDNNNFGDMAFDASGNLWMADYNNNSVMAFPHATLGGTNAYTVVSGGAGPFPVVNTGAGLTGSATYLFTSPEGVAFDSSGNLWVGNNNDGYETDGNANSLTTLVQLTAGVLDTIVAAASASGGSVSLAPVQALTLAQVRSGAPPEGYAVYRVPQPPGDYKTPQFGGLQIDMLDADDLAAGKPQYLYANDEVGSTVQQYDVNPNSPTFLASIASGESFALTLLDANEDAVVTNPGNGGIALVYAHLLIADSTSDTGAEPDAALPNDSEGNPIFWESLSLGVGASATPPANFASAGTIEYTPDAYVYVNVQNIGCTATTGTERLRVYWASGAISQSWPAPWDGSGGASAGGEITTATGEPLPVIEPGASWTTAIAWPTMPDPALNNQNTHWCLLARIETQPVYPFGMTYWEKTQQSDPGDPQLLSDNVVNNSKIAQRNIFIGPDTGLHLPPREILNQTIWAANFATKATPIRIGFQLLDEAARPLDFTDARLVIHVEDPVRERLLAAWTEGVEHLGDGRFHCHRPERGIGGIRLQPGEKQPLKIEFRPPGSVHDFAFRVMQYDESDSAKRRLVGGQTFVFGKVKGFTVR